MSPSETAGTSETYDVIVLGSGATGLTAAFTAAHEGASVAVFEKNDKIGGTSAWSGAHVWVPNNPHMAKIGAEDSTEDAMTYLNSLSRGIVDERLTRAFVENGPRMVSYLEEHEAVKFLVAVGLPDYQANKPGGKPGGGRTMGTELFPYEELGEWKDKVEVSPYFPTNVRIDEFPVGARVPNPPSQEELDRRAIRDERGVGSSLVGALLAACLREGVGIELSTPAVDLIVEGGRVTGAVVEGPGGRRTVRARRGVVLATGGFEWNEEYRTAFLRGPFAKSASITTNTGDGLRMAMKVGCALQNMREAWWIPIAPYPDGAVNSRNLDMINTERTRPRSIMVNSEGRRFANEATNYNSLGAAFHEEDVTGFRYENIPAYLVFDHGYVTRYGFPGSPDSKESPEWVAEAPTPADLAKQLGIPVAQLEATIEAWNANVATGKDPEFHRGECAHDLWWGDPYTKGTIEATLGALDEAPFYALELQPGALGTKGGPKVDAHTRVIDLDGNVIPGLYAVGNASSPTGAYYGGSGGTLGPGMTFAWIAGRHVATA